MISYLFNATTIFLLLCFTLSTNSIAEDFKIVTNPLIDYHQQLKDLKRECFQADMPEECKIKIKSLSDEMESLRKHCVANPNDYRCDALERKNTDRVDPYEELCSKDQYASKCVRHRSAIRENAVRMVKYCKERPESSRCKPLPPPKKREPFLVSFCRANPNKKMCVKHFEEERAKKDPYYKEDRANAF